MKPLSSFLLLFLGFSTAPYLIAGGGTLSYADAKLMSYIQRVLHASDEALSLDEDLELAAYRVAGEADQFRTVVRPIANLAVDSTSRPQTGLEFTRKTRWGVAVSGGYATDGISGDRTSRSFARLSIPVMQRFGRESNELPLTKAELGEQRIALEVTRRRQHLVAEAFSSHIGLVLAETVTQQAETAVERASRSVAAAQARQSVGLVSKVDVHRAELGRLERAEAFEQALLVRQFEQDTYAELAQLDSTQVTSPTALPALNPLIPDHHNAALRSEWHMHQIDTRIAQLDLAAAKRRMRPDIQFEVAWLGSRHGGVQYLHDQYSDVHFALRLNSDLDFRSKRRAVKSQEISVRRLARAGLALERRLLREARQAQATVASEGRRATLAEQRKQEAQHALKVARVRFDRGVASNLDVINAEAALAEAELALLRSSAQHLRAIVDHALARGDLSVAWLETALSRAVAMRPPELHPSISEGNRYAQPIEPVVTTIGR